MTPFELLSVFARSPGTAMSFVVLLAMATLIHLLVHELGHCAAAAFFGVSTVQWSIGCGPRWLNLRVGRCKVAVGVAFLVGGSTTYASEIDGIRPVPRAMIAAGGALGDGVGAVLFAALASALSLPWLWLFMYVFLVSSVVSISPLHSDGRKVISNLFLAFNRRIIQ